MKFLTCLHEEALLMEGTSADKGPSVQVAPGKVTLPKWVPWAIYVGWVSLFVFGWQVYNPTISPDFLLVYFGVSSALAVAVWSVLRTGARPDTMVVAASLFFNLAAVTAVPALILPPSIFRNGWLATSISTLFLGVMLLFVDSLLAWHRATK